MGIEQFPVSNQEETPKPTVETTPKADLEAKDEESSEAQGFSAEERLEAREFSKENSRAARSRLAKQIMQKRWWYRVRVPEITAEQDAVVAIDQEKVATQQSERMQTLEDLEKSLVNLKTEREQWVALETELNQVGTQLEKVKAGFWAYFLNRFTKKIDKLEARRVELYQQEELTPRVSEWAVPSAERDLKQKTASHQQSTEYEKGGIQRMLDKNAETLQSLIKDDDWAETSKRQIKEFYEKNLELKRNREDNPELRDVTENCRKNNIVLMHGFPIGIDSADTAENQPSFETYSFLGEERALVMAALEPAVAVSSKSLDPALAEQFSKREMYYLTGFILGGGEVMSAYKTDAGTYAHDLDSRFPKYDSSAASDYQMQIAENLQQAITSPEERNSRPIGAHNEISVKHPKIAALYIHDEKDLFGKSRVQLIADGLIGPYGNVVEDTVPTSQAVLKKMLGLAERMGLPLILTKKSGEMISLTDGRRPVTLDELLDNPISYSPEERLSFLDEANVAEKMREATGAKTQQQIARKMTGFAENFEGIDPVMEERKQRNKGLAAVQLRLLNL
jgi:hypothetical protein